VICQVAASAELFPEAGDMHRDVARDLVRGDVRQHRLAPAFDQHEEQEGEQDHRHEGDDDRPGDRHLGLRFGLAAFGRFGQGCPGDEQRKDASDMRDEGAGQERDIERFRLDHASPERHHASCEKQRDDQPEAGGEIDHKECPRKFCAAGRNSTPVAAVVRMIIGKALRHG
jgi:hypothetical protein